MTFLPSKVQTGSLLVVEHAQAEVRALGLEIVELVGEVRKRVGAGGGGCHLAFSDLRGDCYQFNTGWGFKNQFAVPGSQMSVGRGPSGRVLRGLAGRMRFWQRRLRGEAMGGSPRQF